MRVSILTRALCNLPTLVALLGLLMVSSISQAEQSTGSHALARSISNAEVPDVDLTYRPISTADVIKQTDMDAHDPSALYMLVGRATFSKHYVDMLRELVKLNKAQPNNPVIIDTLLYAVLCEDIVQDDAASMDEKVLIAANQIADVDRALALDPKLWLTLLLKGQLDMMSDPKRGLQLETEAAALAPNNSIPHYYLCSAYTRTDIKNFEKALSEANTALRLRPYWSRNWLAIDWLYQYAMRDPAKAREAGVRFLKSVPPDAVDRLDEGARLTLGLPIVKKHD